MDLQNKQEHKCPIEELLGLINGKDKGAVSIFFFLVFLRDC